MGNKSSSNRKDLCSFTEDPGIDRLAFSFPVEDYEKDRSAWYQRRIKTPTRFGDPYREMVDGRVEVAPGVEAFVGVQEMPSRAGGTRPWAKFEFNPSRVADPGGYSLATTEQARDVIPSVIASVLTLVQPACPVEEFRTKRVDTARDFAGLTRPDVTIRALGPIPRTYAKRNLVHADPSRFGAQTLMVGSGQGVCRVYNKAAETQGRAPEGTVRWEAECRAAWASNYGGIRTLSDLTPENVRELARNRWEWSQMGVEVVSTSRVVDVVANSGLSPREQAAFLGWLLMQAHGGSYRPGSEALAKWRKVQRDLGVTLDEVRDGGPGFVSRLDWESGREVCRAA